VWLTRWLLEQLTLACRALARRAILPAAERLGRATEVPRYAVGKIAHRARIRTIQS